MDPVRRLSHWAIGISCAAVLLSLRTCNLTERSFDIASTTDLRLRSALRTLNNVEKHPQLSMRPTRLPSGAYTELVRDEGVLQLRMMWTLENSGKLAAKNVRFSSVLSRSDGGPDVHHAFDPLPSLPPQTTHLLEIRKPWGNGGAAGRVVDDLVEIMRTTVTYEEARQSSLSYRLILAHEIEDGQLVESQMSP